jgi:hypothetical protein
MDGRTGIDGFAADLELQRAAIGERVPVYGVLFGHVLALLDGELGERLANAWRDRRFFIFYDRPLLLLTALRHDAMAEGPAHPLHAALVADPPQVAAATREALVAALAPERTRAWRSLSGRVVQTNETSRAVAWRWPATFAGARPLVLVDLGASAGLNLVAGALPAIWSDAAGAPLPVAGDERVVARMGLDARPLDVRDDDVAAWLRAAVWPGETARLARLDAAIAAMRAARATGGAAAPELHATSLAGARPLLDEITARAPRDALVLAYQTVVREYVSPDERAAYDASMRAWLASAEPGRAAWIELEIARGGWSDPIHPAALDAHINDQTLRLARCDFHPRELVVDESAAHAFAAALQVQEKQS